MKSSQKNFIKTYSQLLLAIESCLEQQYLIPALVLIYTAIDGLGWLATDEEQGVGVRFQDWVNRWMLSNYPLPCNAQELYAARCAVLHTLTPNTKKGERQIDYAWGSAKESDLAEAISAIGKKDDVIAVHVYSLLFSFRNGLVDFVLSTRDDPQAAIIFQMKTQQYFSDIDNQTMADFIKMSRKADAK